VFDSGAKEALFLHEQGIPFEVVPGIPAAFGASAHAGVPVTYPGGGDTLVLLRGEEDRTDAPPDLDWNALAKMEGTIVCYAGGRLAVTILRELLAHGVPSDRQAALIFDGTMPGQRTETGTIEALSQRESSAADSRPGILVIGEVVNLRQYLRWFDERPLFGKKIVVTRSREQAGELVDLLEDLGAEAIEAPTLKMAPADDPESVDRAASSIDGYDWVIFESASAVERLMDSLARGPRDVRSFGRVSICAIGPSTADRLGIHGLKPDVTMPELRVEGVGDALDAKSPVEGKRVLIVRPDHLHDHLAKDLARRGAAVSDLVAYRSVPETSESEDMQNVYRQLLDGAIDAVTFASATAVGQFAAAIGRDAFADLLQKTVVAAIGPVTAAAAAELGITAQVVPESYTVEGLVKALVEHFAQKSV
jgi:uroporphyrinogen III methyltransferase/synthase